MTFVALLAALLIEQTHALPTSHPLNDALRRYVQWVARTFDAGKHQQGVIAWFVVIAPPVLAVAALHGLAAHIAAPLGLVVSIGVLYLTMGFRQFSHPYNAVLDALRADDIERARSAAALWIGQRTDEMNANDLARLAIERGLIGAYRHVFAVIAWFAVFGAAGAAFYRLAAMLRDAWGRGEATHDSEFGNFSRDMFAWCDWIPCRLAAASFAVVGNFEDAVYCWRTQARAWPDAAQGIVLASGAGAIGVRLGSGTEGMPPDAVRPEMGMGDDADAELMTSAIGLIWRAVVVWLFVVLLVTVASWLG